MWLLDEPTEGLDGETARAVLARLTACAEGRTLVVATHIRREAELCDRLLVMAQGRITARLARGEPGFDAMLAGLRPELIHRCSVPTVAPPGPPFIRGNPRRTRMEFDIVSLSRLQFAMTALYHFLFVPLTLGLSIIVAIMETVYVMTGPHHLAPDDQVLGHVFGINFVLGVATGTRHGVPVRHELELLQPLCGRHLRRPLAIEGLMAFFLEATFVGLFFFGWDRMSKVGHLVATWAVAFGSNFSALWILIANGWMQNPVGAVFNPQTMRMEVDDFYAVLFNPVAQAKFVHTVSAGYTRPRYSCSASRPGTC